MKGKQTPETPDYVTVKIPRELYEEVGALLPYFADDPVVRATGRVSKALALRLTLLRGIAAVRASAKAAQPSFQLREKGDTAA